MEDHLLTVLSRYEEDDNGEEPPEADRQANGGKGPTSALG